MNEAQDHAAEAEVQIDELTLLKQQADKIGLKYHPSIGVDALRTKIAEALTSPGPVVNEPEAKPVAAAPNKMSRRKELQMEALKLVRLRITNLNPQKKDLQGEIFTVSNSFIGDVKRFVPFGETTEDGTHLEWVIYKQLKARRFLQVKTRKDPRHPGQMIVDQKWVPEFALEVLDQLTEEELKELARTQAAAGSLHE
jgi:hypothetical protein